MKDSLYFFKEGLKTFKLTGAVLPSSPWAARALAAAMVGSRKPMNILEVGPGTGPVTNVILDRMIPGDHATICEINPRFMEALKERISKHPRFAQFEDSITFFLGPVQDLPEDKKYDAIVCAIPFLNLDAPTVQEIFEKLLRLSGPETVMSYFEYIGLRKLGKLFGDSERVQEVENVIKKDYMPRRIDLNKVWLNVLPINIYTLSMAPVAA